MRRALVIGILLVIGGPRAAHAGDGENALSAGVGYGTFWTDVEDEDETASPTAGGVVTATFERGFTDYASWRVRAVGGLYAGGGTSMTGLATAGLSYRFDVLKYVPYVAVGVGALVRGGGPFDGTDVEPALEIGGGVDWLRSRSRSIGLDVAVTGFAFDTTTLIATLRTTWRWGYF